MKGLLQSWIFGSLIHGIRLRIFTISNKYSWDELHPDVCMNLFVVFVVWLGMNTCSFAVSSDVGKKNVAKPNHGY
jgi:hypothetical protein